jgi:hypothetical protein
LQFLAKETLEWREASDNDGYTALHDAPYRQTDGVSSCTAHDLRESNDGNGDDAKAETEDHAQTGFLALGDLQAAEQAEREGHDEQIGEDVDRSGVGDRDDASNLVDWFGAFA